MSPAEGTPIYLGYLLVTTPIPNTYIGGAMVTDQRGLPVEFRYTEPIQPTKIQQILYGQVLSTYIKREVILETLLQSLETRFQFLLVNDESFLTYPARPFKIARISETKSPRIGEIGKSQLASERELLLQLSKEGAPIRLQFGQREFTAEDSEESMKEPFYAPLILAGQTMDIYEPLKRIEKALETICQEVGIHQTL